MGETDQYAALLGSLISNYAGSKGAGANGQGQPVAMSRVQDFRTSEAIFDNSGWNVGFGNSQVSSSAKKNLAQSGASMPAEVNPGGGGVLLPASGVAGIDQATLVFGVGVLLLLVALKQKKSK